MTNDGSAPSGSSNVCDDLSERSLCGEEVEITREDVRRVAETYLKADRVRVIVVGDPAVVKEGLGSLGLGPVDVRKPPVVSPEATASATPAPPAPKKQP